MELNDNKLLAVITYKNLFPRDFVELQTSRGYVYQLFQNKNKFIEERMKTLQKEISSYKSIEEELDKELCESMDELDAIFYVEDKLTKVNNKFANQFSTRAEYVAEIKQNNYMIQEGEPYFSDYEWTSIDVKDKFDALLLNEEYKQRKLKIENKTNIQKISVQSKKHECEKKLEKLKDAYLKDIISRENEDDIFSLGIKNSEMDLNKMFPEIMEPPYFSLIKYLIRNGYIDETYPDYMTFFYAKSISARDKIFLRSITDKMAKDYEYALDDVQHVISRIRMTDFEEEECWNYALLNALLENVGEYKEQTQHFMSGLGNKEPADFVNGYISKGNNIQAFVDHFNRADSNAVIWILVENLITEKNRRQYVLATLYGADEEELLEYKNKGVLAEYVNKNVRLYDIDPSKNRRVIKSFRVLDVQLKSIDWGTENQELLQAVYTNNMYQLTWENIDGCLAYMYGIPYSVKNRTKSFTLILSKEQALAKYVKDNLGKFVSMQIKENKILEEEEDTIIYVLNDTNLKKQTKSDYIKLLTTKLSELSFVEDKNLWIDLIPNNIDDDCKNIFDYFFLAGKGMDDELVFYINKYQASLTFDTVGLDGKYGANAEKKLFEAIVKNNDIIKVKYRQMLHSFSRYPEEWSISGISKKRMKILIQDKILKMSLNNLHFMRSNYADSVNVFIEENLQDYIDIMTEADLVDWEIAYILKMSIKDEDKIKLLKLERKPISVMHKNYSSEVIVYILRHLLDINEKEQLYNWYPDEMPQVQNEIKSILLSDFDNTVKGEISIKVSLLKDLLSENAITLDDKKMLLANSTSHMHKDEVEDCLDILHLENYKGLFEGKIQIFEKSNSNEKLLIAFQTRGWISDYKEDEIIFTAYGRKSQENKIS